MARIYVSSTWSDLKDHRAQVRRAIRRMGHDDVAMEYYVAEDQRPLDKCLADVRASDLYIGLFAFRYGFIPAGYAQSITELEFRTAVSAGKECLIFLLAEDAPWPANLIEFEAYDKIKALRDELGQRYVADFFTNKADLEAGVCQAINTWEKRHGVERSWTDWDQYRQALFEAYRWVRLTVIAGAKQDRMTQIPLTDVFVPQMTQRGRPTYEIPDEVLRLKRELFGQKPREGEQAETNADSILMDTANLGDEEEEAEEETIEALVAFPESVLDVLGRERMQVVLGGPGSGKSTLLYTTILELCASDHSDSLTRPALQHRPVPLLIDLRQYVLKRSSDFLTYLVSHIEERYGVRVDRDSLAALLRADKRALLIFDGLDEIFDPTERENVIQKFQTLARQYPHAQIVVSSRIVGYDPVELGVAGFEHYTLLDFTTLQIRQFVPRWYQHYTWEGDDRDAHGLIQRILDNPRLQDLAGNPLLLTMMAIIYKHQDLPEQRWKLYERCTEVLLEDWDIKRKRIDRKTLPLDITIRAGQKAEMLQRVALYMLEHGQAGRELNAIAYQPLLNILSQYLEERYQKAPAEAEAIAHDILGHLRERTYILAEVGEGIFGFVHRTFMEYFAAVHYKAEFNAREADYDWLTQEVFGRLWRRDEWQEVLFLLSAMLADQGSPFQKVVHYLSRQGAYPDNLAFAARCLAETGVIEDVAQAQQLILSLAWVISGYVHRSNTVEASAAVDTCMTAFVMLAPMLAMPPSVLEVIGDLEQARTVRERMAAWQMSLALRSRQERRAYALTALTDKQEVVRRGAIALLEREWSGNKEVGQALIEVVRADRHVRVRQAALEAIGRGWPDEQDVLTAIESRVVDETAYTYALWLVNYLATNWRGHPRARRLIIHFSEWKSAAYHLVTQTAVKALAQAWHDDPETLPLLRSWVQSDQPAPLRLAALQALVQGWHDDELIVPMLHRCVRTDENTGIRKAALEMLGQEWPKHPDTLPLLHDQAVHSSKAAIREKALMLIVGSWEHDPQLVSIVISREISYETAISLCFGREDLSTLPLLQDRAVNDPSSDVRSRALEAIGKGWPTHPVTHALLHVRAVHDIKPGVRWTAILLLVEDWANDPQTLSLLHNRVQHDDAPTLRALIVMTLSGQRLRRAFHRQTSINESYQREVRDQHFDYDTGFSIKRSFFFRGKDWRSVPETQGLLHDLARNDPAATVRGQALLGLVRSWGEYPETPALVRERQADETDPQVLTLIERSLSELHPGSQEYSET